MENNYNTTTKDEVRLSLTNYLGRKEYTISAYRYESQTIDDFNKLIKNKYLYAVLKVGFSGMKHRIIDSSRALSHLSTIEYNIKMYLQCLTKDCRLRNIDSKLLIEFRKPDYKLYVFFIYLYFVCPEIIISHDLSKQRTLDTMLVYSITKKYDPMLEFVFCAVVCERQIYDTPLHLKCSQYEDLNDIIKSFSHQKDAVISEYETSTMDKVYINSYTDSYSEALNYQNELENFFSFTL